MWFNHRLLDNINGIPNRSFGIFSWRIGKQEGAGLVHTKELLNPLQNWFIFTSKNNLCTPKLCQIWNVQRVPSKELEWLKEAYSDNSLHGTSSIYNKGFYSLQEG
ncbi:hypothetical protein Pst134EB_016738 [Puccinia striiformis f. sp. tritici]|nr:hypothetical protein Pst134EB_016738 [Puccinia striiformis f. sp. tritici]